MRPGDERPKLPEFEPPDREKILPDVPLPKGEDKEGLSGGVRIFIKRYEFSGNTVLSDEELEKIAAPYTDKSVSLADLEKIRDEITEAYIKRGFINSGAVIPDQDVKEGVFTFQIIEGKLTGINVETDGRLWTGYFTSRLKFDSREPLDIFKLEKKLQILQMDDRIKRIDAKLSPGEKKGEALLDAKIKENYPLKVALDFNNYQPPTVGDFRGQISISHNNIMGLGDRGNANYSYSQGFQIIGASYGIPVTPWDTYVGVYFRKSSSTVLEEPFVQLDIDSKTLSIGGRIAQPLYRSLNHSVSLFVTGEYKRADTFLFGSPFTFAAGADEGISKIFVIRFGQDYVYRGRKIVFAARSTLSYGMDKFGATVNEGNIPDGQFFSWLGQVQFAYRLPWYNWQVIARSNTQLTDSPLLGLEQFAVGGHASVRGYRENQLVNDNGTNGSVEIRVPFWRSPDKFYWAEWAVFFDAGYSWNQNRETVGPTTLISSGAGIRLGLGKNILFQAYWGHKFKKVPPPNDHDIQDDGLHAGMSVTF